MKCHVDKMTQHQKSFTLEVTSYFVHTFPLSGACTIKYYGFVMYRFCSKFLQASLIVTEEKTLAYNKICPFSVNCESVMFCRTGPQLEATHIEWAL